jgi:hypothetical protein
MKTAITSMAALALACAGLVQYAFAQKGMGERSGVARQAVKPEIVRLSGKLVEVKTGPCEKTTGRAPVGTHILLENKKGETLNIHLGPEAAMADTVAKLSVGKKVTVKAFRTDKMPEGHYTAQSLTFGKTTVELRDARLRPVWAGPQGGKVQAAQPASPRAEASDDTDEQPPTTRPGPGRGRRGGGPPWAGGQDGRGGGGGPPWAGGGRGPDAAFQADRTIFHFLLENHDQIQRKVTKRTDGVETVTESDDPTIALAIQGHAEAMHQRVEKLQPVHMRDPLFAAVFSHAKKIEMKITKIPKGVQVVETSTNPYVVKLIQAHAAVVNRFVANGFSEARQNHDVPKD